MNNGHPENHYHFLIFCEFWLVGSSTVTSGPPSGKFLPRFKPLVTPLVGGPDT